MERVPRRHSYHNQAMQVKARSDQLQICCNHQLSQSVAVKIEKFQLFAATQQPQLQPVTSVNVALGKVKFALVLLQCMDTRCRTFLDRHVQTSGHMNTPFCMQSVFNYVQHIAGILYKNSMDCLLVTIRNEGFFGLYKGFVPCWIRMAPWSLTFWISFEQIRLYCGAKSWQR